MKPLSLALICCAAALAQGIQPRAGLSDYAAHAERDSVAIGAQLLAPEEVRSSFVSDLNRTYLVIEVELDPHGERSVHLSDFSLRVGGSRAVLRPVSAKVIAGVLQKTAPSPNDVSVYPSVGVGYGTGPRGYDPVTGTTRGGGWNTSVGVGVGVGGSQRPASTDQDRKTMELELSEKGLPEGLTSKPVAGYIYFPLHPKKHSVTYDLEYHAGGDSLVLPLTLPKQP